MITLARQALCSRTRRHPATVGLFTAALALLTAAAPAQQLSLPADVLGAGETPLLSQGSGDFVGSAIASDGTPIGGMSGGGSMASSGTLYNPATGSHLRAQYNTESYGQAEGNLNLGTMILREIDGGVGFFDGQVTLNDESNVGYNLGAGYRWMTLPFHPYSPDDAKIMGVSVWADGQGAGGENFFPQIGTSLEFLGDRLDFRANGYAVLGDRTQSRDFVNTGDLTFFGNNLADQTVGVLDTALTVAEVEGAARIADLEAWVFGGAYAFRGGPYDEVGGKVGLRGYITPDLNLSVAITHDDLFETNGVMRLTWFIGRTRRDNCPTGTLRDRLREPVIRNDYIAIAESTVFGAGAAITDADDEAIRIVHVDSSAPDGGDGSFENPLNSLDDIRTNSMEGDIILGHAESSFTGQSAVLQDDQTFVGEGAGNEFNVTTLDGVVSLPETAAGALDGNIPVINDAPAAAVLLSDDNTVTNLEFDGGVNAIATDNMTPASSNNATLTELVIANTSGDAISLMNVDRQDVDDDNNDGDTDETFTALGTVTIDDVMFSGVMGADIAINGFNATADVVFSDTINISNVDSTGNTGTQSLLIEQVVGAGDVSDGGSPAINVTDYTVTNSGAGLTFENNGAAVTMDDIAVSNTTDGAGYAIAVVGATGATNINSASINNIAGGGIRVDANTQPVTIGSAGDDGEVSISNATGALAGILIDSNDGDSADANGTVTIQNVDIDNVAADGIIVQSNTAAVNIGAAVDDGEVTINDATGNALLVDMADAAVSFDNGSTITGGGNGVVVRDSLDDGDVTVGATVEINDVGGQAVIVEAVANPTVEGAVTVDADLINDTANGGGVRVSDNEGVVTFGGAIETLNTDAVVLMDTQNNVAFSGDITSNGSGDTITVTDAGTNTTSNADVTFTGAITNDDDANGSVVVISGGDDEILFSGAVDDTGEGIQISGRLANTNDAGADPDGDDSSTVNFTGVTTLDNASGDSVALGTSAGAANDDDAIISFTDLTIENSGAAAGNAIIGVSVGDFSVLGGSILTDNGAAAIDLENGSSTNGLTFDSIDVTGGNADTAIRLVNFDGTLNTSEGTLETTALAVEIEDASFIADFLEIDSGNDMAITALYNDDTTRALLIDGTDPDGGSNASFNGGAVSITTAGAGDVTSNLADIDDLGEIAFNSGGSDSSTLSLTDLTTNGGFDFDVTGDGNLTVTANDVESSAGNTTIDVTGAGSFIDGLTDFQTAGQLIVTGDGASTGDITVTASSVSETTTFTQVTVNDNGGGTVNVTLDGVETSAAADVVFNSAGDGDATLTLIDGSYAGGVDFNATNDDNATLDITGGDYAGGVTFDTSNNVNNATLNVTDGDYDAGITATAANDGTLGVSIDGSTTLDTGGVGVTTTNNGDFTANVTGVTADNGGFSVTADNTAGVANVTLGTSDFGDDVAFSTDAAGDATFTVTGSVTADGATGVDIDATNEGDFTANITGVTADNGAFNVLANADTDDVDVTLNTSSFGGDIDIASAGSGTFDVMMTGPVTTDGATGVTIAATNGNTFTTTITNITADNGGFDVDADNTVGDATVSVTNGDFGGAIDVTGSNPGDFSVAFDNVDSDSTLSIVTADSMDDATVSVRDGSFLGDVSLVLDNDGQIDVTFNDNTVDTSNDETGLNVLVQTGVTTGSISIANNNVTTGDDLALNLDIDDGSINVGVVGNTFTNNSATVHNTLIDAGGVSVVGATVTSNTFLNSNGAPAEPEFEILTSVGTSEVNLNIAANTATFSGGPAGNGEIVIRQTPGSTFGVFELDETFMNTGDRNNATVTFDPNDDTQFDDLAAPPTNPAP